MYDNTNANMLSAQIAQLNEDRRHEAEYQIRVAINSIIAKQARITELHKAIAAVNKEIAEVRATIPTITYTPATLTDILGTPEL